MRLPRSARRTQLLAAARDVFVQRGYHAAAMDEIADRAGVSKPVLYQHFPGKLELYLALLDASAEELERRIRDALRSTEDNKQRVAASIAAYFDYVDTERSAYRLVLESDLRSEPAVRDRVERNMATVVDAIAEVIAKDTGAPTEEARLLAVGLVGISEVSARHWLSNPGRIRKEEAVRLLDALAWRGLSGFPRTR
jgi:AcrR family transcriptional regulator